MPRESGLEADGTKLLHKAGFWTMKAGKQGWPDRLVLLDQFAGPGKRPPAHVWFEWKQMGGSLTPAQERRIPALRARGEIVEIITSPEMALERAQYWRAMSP